MLESAQNKLYDPRLEHDACGIGAVVIWFSTKISPIQSATCLFDSITL